MFTGQVDQISNKATWQSQVGVLGIHLWSGLNERQAAITGAPVPGTLSTATNAIKAIAKK